MRATEKMTDHIIYGLMTSAGLNPEPEKTRIREVQEALKTASKRMTGKAGKPEFIAMSGNYLIIVEDKADTKYQANYMTDKNDTLLMDTPSVEAFAENGALHYAQHITFYTSFKKVFAFGCSGTEKEQLRIRPIFVTDKSYKVMPAVRDFTDFKHENIDNYYRTKVLGNKSERAAELEEILGRAKQLHEDLRNYGSLSEQDKPVIVSGILLALCNKNFSTEQLTCNIGNTKEERRRDGEKIYDAIKEHIRNVDDTHKMKIELVPNQFEFIKLRPQLSTRHPALGKSPLRYFAEYIHSKILSAICNNSPDDVLGRFYGEFLSYSGGDGKGLGIVLTPSHITELMVDLLDIKISEKVIDPCCGTAGFLIAAMSKMFKQADNPMRLRRDREEAKMNIRRNLLYGVEMNDRMFSVATTNMILRGDGKSNLICDDFLKLPVDMLRKENFRIGLMNPPYSQAKNKQTAHLSELRFIQHLLDGLGDGARCAVIVPQSTMVGKTKMDAAIKEQILEKHTLEGVITLNPQTFYKVGTNPVIAVFTAHVKHSKRHFSKFINFKDDGYEISPHIGLLDNGTHEQKKQQLLDCWLHNAPAKSSFMVKAQIEASDEWLHSFYYFNDEIPSDDDFERTMADYLTFEFKMIANGRGYLFGYEEK